jgi:hypothetical protein
MYIFQLSIEKTYWLDMVTAMLVLVFYGSGIWKGLSRWFWSGASHEAQHSKGLAKQLCFLLVVSGLLHVLCLQ